VTTSIDRGLLASVTALLKELGWFGLAEIQFVVPPGGEPRLIDLNGRFYGSLSLALKAGVNLSDAWARVTLDLPVTSSEGGSSVRYQWLTADLRRARSEKKGGVVRDTLGCFAFAPTATHSIWSPSDPAPTGAYFRNEL
jgi:predicted ATP-grasp superfamily ATP-dependent carboligase